MPRLHVRFPRGTTARAATPTQGDLFSLSPKSASSARSAGNNPCTSYNPNASFYDIRAYFQGFTNGKMNSDSPDATYTALIADLRTALRALAAQIEPKIYAHGFLRR